MAPQPPSFGSQEYWETRFKTNQDSFDWLGGPAVLDPYLLPFLDSLPEKQPEILHIGCGTSDTSFHLREILSDPHLIHNVDYSPAAVDLGKEKEADIAQDDGLKCMRWSAVNLLVSASVLQACNVAQYSVIIDKSTSDAIACADDVHPSLLCKVSTSTVNDATPSIQSPELMDPLHVLAINLALLTKPKARWISLSYSQDRYSFLQTSSCAKLGGESQKLSSKGFDGKESGLPHPNTLWKMTERHEIEAPTQEANGNETTHRPKVTHWVYILERTDVPLFLVDHERAHVTDNA